jgi:hypothetical protein
VQTLGCNHQVCTGCLGRLERRLCPLCRVQLPDYDPEQDRRTRLELIVGPDEAAARERRRVQARKIQRLIRRYARAASQRETLVLLADISQLTQRILTGMARPE